MAHALLLLLTPILKASSFSLLTHAHTQVQYTHLLTHFIFHVIMSDPSAAAKPARPERARRRKNDSDDDEDEQQEQQQVTVQQTDAAPPADVEGDAKEQPVRPARVRAKAPSAAKAPPAAPVMPPTATLSHVDPNAIPQPPSSVASPPPPAAADSPGEESSAVPSPVPASAKVSEDIFALDYDTLTYAKLMSILQANTRAVIEELMVQREQDMQNEVQQMQSQRVERFLDVGTTAPAGSSSENGASASAVPAGASEGNGANEDHCEGYTYNEMLTRLFEALNRNNEGTALQERNQVPVPVLEKIGKKKTVISNFGRICEAFHRPLEDVKDFIEKELSIRGNLDMNNALILKFEIRKATDFDRVLIKYLDEYVKCNSCHRIDTTLTKDGRRMELRCNWCTATRTVTAVGSSTFTAQIEKRSRVRAAMTL